MGITAENHYVPQFYLRRWSRDGNSVCAYRLLVSNENVPVWKTASIRGIAKHRHLYTKLVGGVETDGFEKRLDREFERPAEPIIAKLEKGVRLTRGDWILLARFAAAQDVRTPARFIEQRERWIKSIQPMLNSTLESAVQEYTSGSVDTSPRGHRSKPGMRDFPLKVVIEKDDQDQAYVRAEVIVGRRMWLSMMDLVLSSTIKALHGHWWTALQAPSGMSWPTSDDPVVKLNYYNAGSYDFKGGWGNPGTELLFPLSPRYLLYTKIGSKPPLQGVVPLGLARQLCRFILERAHRTVITLDPTESVVTMRPRLVDAQLYKHETAEWQRFADEQAQAEAELGGAEPPTSNSA